MTLSEYVCPSLVYVVESDDDPLIVFEKVVVFVSELYDLVQVG